MSILKKLLILIIIIMTCIVLYKLYLQRVVLLHESFIEGMCSIDGFSPPAGFSTDEIIISDLSSQCAQNMLKDCVIKASHNSANSSDTTVSPDMVSFVISRGVRFLDFELHYDANNGVVTVGTGTADKDKFSTILTKINESAFTDNTTGCESPNKNDPMFIHLRIKTDNNTASVVYDAINTELDSKLTNNKTNINVYPETKLFDIKNKYVIIVDQNSENYFDNRGRIFKNAVSGDGYFKLFNGSSDIQCPKRPTLTSDTTTDITAVNILLEQDTYSMLGFTITGPSMKDMVTTYGMQVIAYKYYGTNTTNREQSEAVFNEFNSAFINLAQCIQYFEALESQ